MHYITKAGVKFLNETQAKIPQVDAITNNRNITPETVEALEDKLPTSSGERSTAKNPAGEARIRAHQSRVDNIKKVKAKTGKELT
tara:strand:+ start:104 stop:358 length:255 start_codon:yes stop_codon:yes gene_type:complete